MSRCTESVEISTRTYVISIVFQCFKWVSCDDDSELIFLNYSITESIFIPLCILNINNDDGETPTFHVRLLYILNHYMIMTIPL